MTTHYPAGAAVASSEPRTGLSGTGQELSRALSPAPDELEVLLKEQLKAGLILLERACPSCSTPLVRKETSGDEETASILDEEKKDESDPSDIVPVRGVPFCVWCEAHVVTDASEIERLHQAEADRQEVGTILVCAPLQSSEPCKEERNGSKIPRAVDVVLNDNSSPRNVSTVGGSTITTNDDDIEETVGMHNHSPAAKTTKHVPSQKAVSLPTSVSPHPNAASIPSMLTMDAGLQSVTLTQSNTLASLPEVTHFERSEIEGEWEEIEVIHFDDHATSGQQSSDDDGLNEDDGDDEIESYSETELGEENTPSKDEEESVMNRYDDVQVLKATGKIGLEPKIYSPLIAVRSNKNSNPDVQEHRKKTTGKLLDLLGGKDSSPHAVAVPIGDNPGENAEDSTDDKAEVTILQSENIKVLPLHSETKVEQESSLADVEGKKLLPDYSVRKEIATRVLGSKMLQGYALLHQQCSKCEMPLMSFNGTAECVVCPVLERRVANGENGSKISAQRDTAQKVDKTSPVKKGLSEGQDEMSHQVSTVSVDERKHNLEAEQKDRRQQGESTRLTLEELKIRAQKKESSSEGYESYDDSSISSKFTENQISVASKASAKKDSANAEHEKKDQTLDQIEEPASIVKDEQQDGVKPTEGVFSETPKVSNSFSLSRFFFPAPAASEREATIPPKDAAKPPPRVVPTSIKTKPLSPQSIASLFSQPSDEREEGHGIQSQSIQLSEAKLLKKPPLPPAYEYPKALSTSIPVAQGLESKTADVQQQTAETEVGLEADDVSSQLIDLAKSNLTEDKEKALDTAIGRAFSQPVVQVASQADSGAVEAVFGNPSISSKSSVREQKSSVANSVKETIVEDDNSVSASFASRRERELNDAIELQTQRWIAETEKLEALKKKASESNDDQPETFSDKDARLKTEINSALAARQDAELEARRLAEERRLIAESRLLAALEEEATVKQREANAALARAKEAQDRVKTVCRSIFKSETENTLSLTHQAQNIQPTKPKVATTSEIDSTSLTERWESLRTTPKASASQTANPTLTEQWETLRVEGRSVMTRRLMSGWALLPGLCLGTECRQSPLICNGKVTECVVCGGTGSGKDGVYDSAKRQKKSTSVKSKSSTNSMASSKAKKTVRKAIASKKQAAMVPKNAELNETTSSVMCTAQSIASASKDEASTTSAALSSSTNNARTSVEKVVEPKRAVAVADWDRTQSNDSKTAVKPAIEVEDVSKQATDLEDLSQQAVSPRMGPHGSKEEDAVKVQSGETISEVPSGPASNNEKNSDEFLSTPAPSADIERSAETISEVAPGQPNKNEKSSNAFSLSTRVSAVDSQSKPHGTLESNEGVEVDISGFAISEKEQVAADDKIVDDEQAMDENPTRLSNSRTLSDCRETPSEVTKQDKIDIDNRSRASSKKSVSISPVIKTESDIRRTAVSKEIAKRMSEGWTMLDLSCPQCVMPMMTDKSKSKEICVHCGVVSKVEESQTKPPVGTKESSTPIGTKHSAFSALAASFFSSSGVDRGSQSSRTGPSNTRSEKIRGMKIGKASSSIIAREQRKVKTSKTDTAKVKATARDDMSSASAQTNPSGRQTTSIYSTSGSRKKKSGVGHNSAKMQALESPPNENKNRPVSDQGKAMSTKSSTEASGDISHASLPRVVVVNPKHKLEAHQPDPTPYSSVRDSEKATPTGKLTLSSFLSNAILGTRASDVPTPRSDPPAIRGLQRRNAVDVEASTANSVIEAGTEEEQNSIVVSTIEEERNHEEDEGDDNEAANTLLLRTHSTDATLNYAEEGMTASSVQDEVSKRDAPDWYSESGQAVHGKDAPASQDFLVSMSTEDSSSPGADVAPGLEVSTSTEESSNPETHSSGPDVDLSDSKHDEELPTSEITDAIHEGPEISDEEELPSSEVTEAVQEAPETNGEEELPSSEATEAVQEAPETNNTETTESVKKAPDSEINDSPTTEFAEQSGEDSEPHYTKDMNAMTIGSIEAVDLVQDSEATSRKLEEQQKQADAAGIDAKEDASAKSQVLTLEIPSNFNFSDGHSLRLLLEAAKLTTPPVVDGEEGLGPSIPSPGISAATMPRFVASPKSTTASVTQTREALTISTTRSVSSRKRVTPETRAPRPKSGSSVSKSKSNRPRLNPEAPSGANRAAIEAHLRSLPSPGMSPGIPPQTLASPSSMTSRSLPRIRTRVASDAAPNKKDFLQTYKNFPGSPMAPICVDDGRLEAFGSNEVREDNESVRDDNRDEKSQSQGDRVTPISGNDEEGHAKDQASSTKYDTSLSSMIDSAEPDYKRRVARASRRVHRAKNQREVIVVGGPLDSEVSEESPTLTDDNLDALLARINRTKALLEASPEANHEEGEAEANFQDLIENLAKAAREMQMMDEAEESAE